MAKDKLERLAVQYACGRSGLPAKRQIRAWVRAALNINGKRGGQITVRFVGAGEGRRLNNDYRDKDYASNVLSFPYALEPRVCGDLVLCAPVLVRQAAEQGKPLEAHCAHLIVHGMLHLQAYDHEASEEQAIEMETQERTLMAALGYPDPYREEV
jgi:probable rRNA maturation factor